MLKKKIIIWFSIAALLQPSVLLGIEAEKARAFVGQDLHLSGKELVSYQPKTGHFTLVFENGFSMSIGANRFTSERAVVWLESVTTELRGRVRIDYKAKVYLEGNVWLRKLKGAKTIVLRQAVAKDGDARVVQFTVVGEVFVTADKRNVRNPAGLELYNRAVSISVPSGPKFVVQPQTLVPQWPAKVPAEKAVTKKPEPERVVGGKEFVEIHQEPERPAVEADESKPEEPRFKYSVHISPAGKTEPELEAAGTTEDGTEIATLTGRFYLWQKQDEQGSLLELQADNAVVFYSDQPLESTQEQSGAEDVAGGKTMRAIYLAGDVVMTEGRRTIRAEQIYYDFHQKKAIVIKGVMKSFDVKRGIPIYVRADKIRQVAENQFSGENIVLTSSEFYRPQVSITASKIIVTDTTTIDERAGRLSDASYDAQMHDVRMKVGERTILRLPFLRSNMQRPDLPIRSAHIGHDSIMGTSLETQWYLYRLLGLKEPEGVEGTLAMDYFGKRGFGTGAEITYKKESYYGRLLGYIIKDSGEDRLGRHSSRRNLEAGNDIRGRFVWEHRQFLPHLWQLTTGLNYQSDENLLESFYRNEFNSGGRQETYLHLKRIEDNRGISILAKARINDFRDEMEETPSVEYHLTGQSLFDDMFTLYSDTQVSRLRQRIGDRHSILMNTDMFSFASHRTEIDMPLQTAYFKLVPFLAGTFGYDDRSGFTRSLVNGTNTGTFGENKIFIGEVGIRVAANPVWKVYPNVQSRIWNLNKLRHIAKPHLTTVLYEESNNAVDQSNVLNMGVSQRLQTKRGPAGEQRTVDWMRLDTDITLVDSSGNSSDGPDEFIWARPLVPLRVLSAPEIFSGDLINGLHRFEMFGPRRDYFGTDYIWRISDTTALLSDMNYDMQSNVVQQFNIGFSRLCWPNLSYYIGSRYLRRVQVLNEKGSNAFTFAATYVLDPRYTLVFAQQFDFDYGANVRSDFTLIRKYHRLHCSFTYSADESLDREAIVFAIWPQGVPELAIGRTRYMGIGTSAGY